MKTIALLAACLLMAACTDNTEPTSHTSVVPPPAATPAVRVVLVGDVMVGRGMARLIETDPEEVFAGVRHLLTDADVASGNLESPLTSFPHVSANENRLEADPDTAVVLAAAGFDILSLPNNHSTDAGPDGLMETIESIESAGMLALGAGATAAAANKPATVVVGDTSIGFLAYDATGVGEPAGPDPGVATWDPVVATAAIRELRASTDAVIVSVHGGAEYLPVTDPGMAEIGTTLAAAGADVVWGHGAHVVQPITVIADARPTVVATSLGNFIFDQSGPARTTGYLLELMIDSEGVAAYRVGVTEHADRRVELAEWLEPIGDAGWIDGSWWSLPRPPAAAVAAAPLELDGFRHGDLTTAKSGDITGDGANEVVASFRRPHRSTPFMETHPEVQWADATGRSAHLGIYEPGTLREIWVAGSVLFPIHDLEVCDSALAISHDQLDSAEPVSASAWTWNGFGFDTAPELPGAGLPGCADINNDGKTEPVITHRN